MYLKLTNESEVRLLRQINCLLGKKKLPNDVLGVIQQIKHCLFRHIKTGLL